MSVLVLDRFGLTSLYLGMAVFHLLLLPLVLTVIEKPASIGQRAFGDGVVTTAADLVDVAAVARPASLVMSKAFWVVVAGGGTLMAVGIIAISHVVALAVERNLSQVQASLLVSVIGATSMVGALLIGILCDRLGPARALALAAAGFCVAWGAIFVTTGLPVFYLAIALHGICSGGVFPAVSVLSRHLFGPEIMARAIGLFYLLTLPFTFFFPPVAGWIRDTTGSYDGVLLLVVSSSALVAVLFFALWRVERRSLSRLELSPLT